ncbi:ABC transporter substrate-binding protein [Lacrimispora sp. JR3]|uniref:ABC transporter substrate-binding protein n=1 Tax=Lacrimispora sinapis TaxID=3111456 RepID=UPI003749DA9D
MNTEKIISQRDMYKKRVKIFMKTAGTRVLAGILVPAVFLMGCSFDPPAPEEGPVSIRVACSAGDIKWKSGMEDVAEKFMEQNKNIKVELYFVPEVKKQTYIERLKVLAAQEEFSDIVELRETGALVQAGLLAPMPREVYSLVASPRLYDGVCYGVPRYTTTLGIIYNRDIFEEMGLSEPETYDDFLNICQKLLTARYDALALGAADIWHMKFWGNYLFRNYMATEDGKVRMTKENLTRMLGDFRDLADKGYINSRYRDMLDSQTAQALSSGQAAMVYTGPWMLSQIENLNPQIRLGFFFLPDKNGVAYAMDDSNVEWGISAETARDKKKMDASVKFLQFYYSEGVYETILELMNADSVTVRKVRMPDTRNQRIMKAAYERGPVHTKLLMEDANSPDGFIAYYDQVLIQALWGDEPVSSLADSLLKRWEMP